jgi:predicted nucleotidyltransferase
MMKFEKLPEGILSRISSAQSVLAEDGNVVFAYLFGGLAAKPQKPLSDVDIAVFVRDVADPAEYKLDLYTRLANALGTAEIDLVVLNSAPTSLTGRILQDKQVLIDKAPFKRHGYESLTLREFFDFRIKERITFKERYGVG